MLGTETTNIKKTKRAIVIGATSGMGRQVAKLLGNEGGYKVGIVGRRQHLLESLQKEISTQTFIKKIDVTRHDLAINQLIELIEEMRGLDLIVISISAFLDKTATNSHELNSKIIDVDVKGFWTMADIAIKFFVYQNYGHLVGISSIDGLRGNAKGPVYSAAKAFVSRYLEGVRNKMIQNKVTVYVTDIIPGWVDNESKKFSGKPGTYWVASTEKAAQEIFEAIQQKKSIAYITKRWKLIAWLMELMPDCIYNAIGGI